MWGSLQLPSSRRMHSRWSKGTCNHTVQSHLEHPHDWVDVLSNTKVTYVKHIQFEMYGVHTVLCRHIWGFCCVCIYIHTQFELFMDTHFETCVHLLYVNIWPVHRRYIWRNIWPVHRRYIWRNIWPVHRRLLKLTQRNGWNVHTHIPSSPCMYVNT